MQEALPQEMKEEAEDGVGEGAWGEEGRKRVCICHTLWWVSVGHSAVCSGELREAPPTAVRECEGHLVIHGGSKVDSHLGVAEVCGQSLRHPFKEGGLASLKIKGPPPPIYMHHLWKNLKKLTIHHIFWAPHTLLYFILCDL